MQLVTFGLCFLSVVAFVPPQQVRFPSLKIATHPIVRINRGLLHMATVEEEDFFKPQTPKRSRQFNPRKKISPVLFASQTQAVESATKMARFERFMNRLTAEHEKEGDEFDLTMDGLFEAKLDGLDFMWKKWRSIDEKRVRLVRGGEWNSTLLSMDFEVEYDGKTQEFSKSMVLELETCRDDLEFAWYCMEIEANIESEFDLGGDDEDYNLSAVEWIVDKILFSDAGDSHSTKQMKKETSQEDEDKIYDTVVELLALVYVAMTVLVGACGFYAAFLVLEALWSYFNTQQGTTLIDSALTMQGRTDVIEQTFLGRDELLGQVFQHTGSDGLAMLQHWLQHSFH